MAVSPLYQRFLAQVAATPDAVALDGPAGAWSYRQLHLRADTVARQLTRIGGRGGRLIGLLQHRSPELVAAILGTVKLGLAYLPLDPRYPAARLRAILADSACSAVIADPAYAHLLPAGQEVVTLEEVPAGSDGSGGSVRPGRAGPDDLAAVFYTSGSAGSPKGVGVSHRNILGLIDGLTFLGIGHGDRIAHVANPAFDAATFEIWPPLTRGATVVVIPQQATPDIAALLRLIRQYGVCVMFLTTSLFRAAATYAPTGFAGLRYVLFGGETADSRSVATVLRSGKPDHLVNVYGPTETTTFATAFEIPHHWDADTPSVPIGVPLAGLRACLLDRELRPVQAGEEGEIYLGGDSVSRGYLAAPGLTAERFVPDPLPAWPGQRLYRTGDLARMTSNGDLDFTRRADDQVKIRGNRVEFAEVEAALRAQPGVTGAAAAVWQPDTGDRRLVACMVCTAGTDPAKVRADLRGVLPEFMVPSQLIRCESLPYNSSGKVDRNAVRALAAGQASESASPQPFASGYLEIVTSAWEETLHHPSGADDNFFDVGGDSLLLLEVHARLQQRLGREIALIDLLEYPTASRLAARLEITCGPQSVPGLPPLAHPSPGR